MSNSPIPPGTVNAVLENDGICVAIVRLDEEECMYAYPTSPGQRRRRSKREKECWVVVTLGEGFAIRVGFDGDTIPYSGAGLAAAVYFDGVRVADTYVSAESIERRLEEREKVEVEDYVQVVQENGILGVERGITEGGNNESEDEDAPLYGEVEVSTSFTKDGYKPFCFALRRTVDQETGVDNIDLFGQICVAVAWAEISEPGRPVEPPPHSDTWKLSLPVDEKLKRGKHRLIANLGSEIIGRDLDLFVIQPVTKDCYKFIFHYAELESLRAEGFGSKKRPAMNRPATHQPATGRRTRRR